MSEGTFRARRIITCAWLILLNAVATAPAHAERLVTALSTEHIRISSNFTGTELVVFGTIERDARTVARTASYEVVITLAGPAVPAIIRRKARVLGIWVNTHSYPLQPIPSFLAVHASRPLTEIAPPVVRARLGLGLEMVPINGAAGPEPPMRSDFDAAFLRLMQEKALYHVTESGVDFLSPELFRASIALPATVPLGRYIATSYLFRDGALLATAENHVTVAKVGFEQLMTVFAHDYAFLYGIATVLLACFTGWIASIVFRRD